MKARHVMLALAIFAAAGAAAFAGTVIQDRLEYRPSTDLVMGALDDTMGYQVALDFQLNLVYQSGIDNSDIDALNDYGLPGTLNFPDNEYYYLKVNPAGGLPIGIWPGSDPQEYGPGSGESWVQWTLSGWWSGKYHTILAGDILEDIPDDPYLRVVPTAGYRPYPWDEFVNDIEVFTGYPIQCEVLGYSYLGTLGPGTTLDVKLAPIPEPISMIFFGTGLVAVGGFVSRRRMRRSA